MTSTFLIIRPQHDIVVNYLFYWSKEILDFANNKNIKFTNFEGEKASRENVEKYLRKQNPRLLVFNGHGTPAFVCGHKDEPLIICNENDDLLNSKIIYAISCDAAKELGKNAVEKGCEAFIGYEGPFGFVRDKNREGTPQKDNFASPFKETSNIIVTSILDGRSVKESVEKSKQLAIQLIKKYSVSDVEPGYREVRFWLFWNRTFLKVTGKENAKFL